MTMLIVPDKVFFQPKSKYFSNFCMKIYIVGNTHLKQVLLYTHKIIMFLCRNKRNIM